MPTTEQLIQRKALELGYEKCGIIPLHRLKGYQEKLRERIERAPASERFYERQKRLEDPTADYPWAKSVVVLAVPYNKYRVPDTLRGMIGKYYLFDIRMDERTEEYQNNREMERYLQGLGLRAETNQKFGIVGMRWAALQAGLGVVRRNNFFYTESGSWVQLEAWLTDRDMELTETSQLPPCPKGCDRCSRACPTGSLSDAYTMNPLTCVSFLTTFGGRDLHREPLAARIGDCVYGCDICQDVCPMNRHAWVGDRDFPGLDELAPALTPQNILRMDEAYYRQTVQPKFFYLSPDDLWKWQVNALNYLDNHYDEDCRQAILAALDSPYEKVRAMAEDICARRQLGDRP